MFVAVMTRTDQPLARTARPRQDQGTTTGNRHRCPVVAMSLIVMRRALARLR